MSEVDALRRTVSNLSCSNFIYGDWDLMRKLLIVCVTAIIALGSLPASAVAQSTALCGVPYAKSDRDALRVYLSDNLRFMPVLFQLGILANQATLNTTTPAERVALNAAYQNYVAAVATMSTWSPPWLKARTRAWLNRIINPNFLNLTGTSLLTVEGAQAAASGILGPVSSAIEKFMICY